MWLDRNIFVFTVLLIQFAVQSNASPLPDHKPRERRLLGWIGYLAGASDHYRIAPFWREWSAVVQVNVQRKHSPPEHAVIVPGYFLYSPPLAAHPHLPHPHEFDDITAESNDVDATVEASSSITTNKASIDDAIETNEKPTKPFRLFPGGRDRRNQKRGIDRRNFVELLHNSDDGEKADVQEITTKGQQAETTETSAGVSTANGPATSESTTNEVIATTTPPETGATESTSQAPPAESEVPGSTDAPTTASIDEQGTTTNAPEPEESTTLAPPTDQPETGQYYGGQPSLTADLIFITTTDDPAPMDSRQDFRPSLQYEFTNYPVEPDQHFLPIIGVRPII